MSAVLAAETTAHPDRHQQLPQRALVVDDDPFCREILRDALRSTGYQVIEAANGSQAVELFLSERPDMLFIDTSMPVLGGREAVRRIRENSTSRFVPVIFLTDSSDEETLVRCIEAGGDDFITKPLSNRILLAKIHAMQRVQRLNDRLNTLYGQMKKDEELAESIFSRAVVAANVAMDRVQTLLQPADVFSGDVLLSAYAPSGDLNMILGDFTGHGLVAALGGLPASEVFRAMTGKGFAPEQILAGINRKLHELMPTGMFFAVQFISISHTLDQLVVCNCGMPDILLLDRNGVVKRRFASRGLPLSITTDVDFRDAIERCRIERGDRVMLISDGVVEARNPARDYFGQGRLQQALEEARGQDNAIGHIAERLAGFCQDAPQDDDISLVEVPCLPGILPHWDPHSLPGASTAREEVELDDAMEFSLTLTGKRLRDADPVPMVIGQLQEIEGQTNRRLLFTVLTELYVNALDHGLLQLDSSLKSGPDGFSRYFEEREQRLQQLQDGFISIRVRSRLGPRGGQVLIQVEDSGDGFDPSPYAAGAAPDHERPSGRGILLLQELCDQVRFEPPGNKVDVLFSWTRGDG